MAPALVTILIVAADLGLHPQKKICSVLKSRLPIQLSRIFHWIQFHRSVIPTQLCRRSIPFHLSNAIRIRFRHRLLSTIFERSAWLMRNRITDKFDSRPLVVVPAINKPLHDADHDHNEEGYDAIVHVASIDGEIGREKEENGGHDHVGDAKLEQYKSTQEFSTGPASKIKD